MEQTGAIKVRQKGPSRTKGGILTFGMRKPQGCIDEKRSWKRPGGRGEVRAGDWGREGSS